MGGFGLGEFVHIGPHALQVKLVHFQLHYSSGHGCGIFCMNDAFRHADQIDQLPLRPMHVLRFAISHTVSPASVGSPLILILPVSTVGVVLTTM